MEDVVAVMSQLFAAQQEAILDADDRKQWMSVI
jgi:hypothetical protein